MPTGQFNKSFSQAGESFSNVGDNAITYNHDNNYVIDLPAGKAGTLTTRTDANTGTATLSAGHGITTGATVDIYWDEGRRYGVTVGTVSGTSVPFDLDAGDDLPITTTPLVVTPQVPIETYIDPANTQVIGAFLKCDSDPDAVGHLDMQDDGDAQVEHFDLAAGGPTKLQHIYNVQAGDTNPLGSTVVTQSYASNGSSTAAAKLYLFCGENA